MRWIWWLLGLAAAGGVVYVISTHTGKPVPKKDACIVDMPKDRKAQVEDAIAKKDGKRLLAYAKQAHDDGWACAARQMEEAAVGAGTAISDAEKKEIERKTKAEAETRAKMNLQDASKSAAEPLGGQVKAVLALTLRPKIGGLGLEVDYKKIEFEKKPTDKIVQQAEDLAAALGVAGYFFAQGQAKDLTDAARRKRDEVASGAATFSVSSAEFSEFATEEPLKSSPVKMPEDPVAALDDPPRTKIQTDLAAEDVVELDKDIVLLESIPAYKDAHDYVKTRRDEIMESKKFYLIKRDTSGALRDEIVAQLEGALGDVLGRYGTGGVKPDAWAWWSDTLGAKRDTWRTGGVSEDALSEVQGVIDAVVGFHKAGFRKAWYLGYDTADTGTLRRAD